MLGRFWFQVHIQSLAKSSLPPNDDPAHESRRHCLKACARWVRDGNIFTSSGVSAGMDMTLAAISTMHGQERAEQVAVWCEYEWHQGASWDPFAKIYGLA